MLNFGAIGAGLIPKPDRARLAVRGQFRCRRNAARGRGRAGNGKNLEVTHVACSFFDALREKHKSRILVPAMAA